MSAYTNFVKKHMKDAKIKSLPPKQRIKAIAVMWRKKK